MSPSDWRARFTKIFTDCKGERVKLLTEREALAFQAMLDYPDDMLEGLGKRLGISGSRVRQLLEKGGEKLLTGGEVTVSVHPPLVSRPERRSPAKLTRQDLVRLTQWMVTSKDKLYGLLPDVAIALVKADTGIVLTEKMLKDVCGELGIKLKPKTKYRVPESQACLVLAKALVALYTELGKPVSDELWALAGREEDEV